MVSFRHLWIGFAATLAAVVLVGCGSNETRLEGSVTFDGQPLDGGTMTLFPIGEPGSEGKRIPVSGEIKEGRYALGDGKNLRPGMYRVEAYWHKKTGKQIPSGDPPNTVDETKQVVPEKYNKNSQTTVDIKAGANKLDLPLTSK